MVWQREIVPTPTSYQCIFSAYSAVMRFAQILILKKFLHISFQLSEEWLRGGDFRGGVFRSGLLRLCRNFYICSSWVERSLHVEFQLPRKLLSRAAGRILDIWKIKAYSAQLSWIWGQPWQLTEKKESDGIWKWLSTHLHQVLSVHWGPGLMRK